MQTRKDFEQNLHQLAEKIKVGEIKFSKHLRKTIYGLTNVRILPNRRINLNTVDEFARSTANAVVSMMTQHERMQKKNADK